MITTVNNEVKAELISNGISLIKHAHNSEEFIQAPSVKSAYIIRLWNTSNKRKMVVIAVDGRNVMNGELANKNDDSGYILNPGQIFDLKGWRRTADEVAAFEFVDLETSYDKQVGGTGSNVGVIGIAVFDEKQVPFVWNHWIMPTTSSPSPYRWDAPTYTKSRGGSLDVELNREYTSCNADSLSLHNATVSNNTSAPAMAGALNSEVIGTGYGAKTEMKTISVTFEKESSTPVQTIVLRYATEPTLKKWGVIKETGIPKVNPFPNDKPAVPAPPGWRG